jgi:Holliday junction resolvase RusA-like endonuclease
MSGDLPFGVPGGAWVAPTEAARPSIVLQLPVPPSLNALWSHPPGRRRRVRSPAYSAWLTEAGWEARRQLVGVPTIQGAFNASVSVPAISRRDTDNWTKPLFDLCQSIGAVRNDSGLRQYVVMPADRRDVLVVLWDLGGPSVAAGRSLAATRPSFVRKPSQQALQFAMKRMGL